jgi:hypothetical protein
MQVGEQHVVRQGQLSPSPSLLEASKYVMFMFMVTCMFMDVLCAVHGCVHVCRLVSSMPYLKGDSPSLLEANVPKITQAYITSR